MKTISCDKAIAKNTYYAKGNVSRKVGEQLGDKAFSFLMQGVERHNVTNYGPTNVPREYFFGEEMDLDMIPSFSEKIDDFILRIFREDKYAHLRKALNRLLDCDEMKIKVRFRFVCNCKPPQLYLYLCYFLPLYRKNILTDLSASG